MYDNIVFCIVLSENTFQLIKIYSNLNNVHYIHIIFNIYLLLIIKYICILIIK